MKHVTKIIGGSLALASFFFLGYFASGFQEKVENNPIDDLKEIIDTYPDLSIYSIKNLSEKKVPPGTFQIIQKVDEESEDHESYIFSFEFDPDLDEKDFKKTTGLLRIPTESKIDEEIKKPATSEANLAVNDGYPLVIMFRGYIDENSFTTGDGTRNASSYFAKNGFITIAPDFLGYGDSSENSANIFESRFQTYTTAISLVNTIGQPSFVKATQGKWNGKDVFLWGHSNGGQITTTVLEATGYSFPTTLWAPVTKPFPYSVLFYTDSSDDGGKFIRSELAKLESRYDADDFSITKNLEKINAKIQLHQGTADTLVPLTWSNEFVSLLTSHEVKIDYNTYPGGDHNLQPFWSDVVAKDVEFFRSNLR